MIYLLSKFFWFLAQPVNLAALSFAVGLGLMRWTSRRDLGLKILRITAMAFVVCTVLPIGTIAIRLLENRFPPLDTFPAHVDGVIVLGGTISPEISVGRNAITLNDSAERETMMLRLARLYPDARILFTGGSAAVLRVGASEADLVERFVAEQGFAPERFIFERKSRNTWENALESRAIAQPRPGETWLLVTSAYHMPRSVGIFRKVGWDVIPCPVDYRTDGSLEWMEFRFLDRLDTLDLALRELYGLAAYWGLGRTSSLFPGPT